MAAAFHGALAVCWGTPELDAGPRPQDPYPYGYAIRDHPRARGDGPAPSRPVPRTAPHLLPTRAEVSRWPHPINSHEDAKPRSLNGPSGERGLVEITLTGDQLVDYLKNLEEDISGGFNANRSIKELSQRMYDAIAPVVDRIEKGKPPAEIPQAVVDDAVVPSQPTTPTRG